MGRGMVERCIYLGFVANWYYNLDIVVCWFGVVVWLCVKHLVLHIWTNSVWYNKYVSESELWLLCLRYLKCVVCANLLNVTYLVGNGTIGNNAWNQMMLSDLHAGCLIYGLIMVWTSVAFSLILWWLSNDVGQLITPKGHSSASEEVKSVKKNH